MHRITRTNNNIYKYVFENLTTNLFKCQIVKTYNYVQQVWIEI